jgi:hypothetical protein
MRTVMLPGLSQNVSYIGSEIREVLFGSNLIFDRDGSQDGNSISNTYLEFAREVNLSTIRYPGGAMTELHFDLARPDSPNQNYMGLATGREPTVGITTFLNFAAEINASATIVLPTYRFLANLKDTLGHRLIDPSEEGHLRSFLSSTLTKAQQAGTKIEAFELGNEWYIENTHVFGFTMSPVEYGRVAAYLAPIVQQEIDKFNRDYVAGQLDEPSIAIQVGPGGNAEWYALSGHEPPANYRGPLVSATNLIFQQIAEVSARQAIDGLISHRYLTSSDRNVSGWSYEPFDTWSSLAGRVPGFKKHFDRYVTEWNVAARNSGELGLKQFDSLIEMTDEMLRAGVSHANIWAVQQRNETKLINNSGLGTESYGGLSFGGIAFDMMSGQLPGLRIISAAPTVDGLVQHSFGSSERNVYFLTNRSEVSRNSSLSLSSN